MPDDEREDAELEALIAARVEHAVEPYRSMLAPEDLADLRFIVEGALRTHPVLRLWLRRMKKDPTVDASGDVTRHDVGDTLPEGKVRDAK